MTPVEKVMVTSRSMIDLTEAKGFSVTSDTLESSVTTYPTSPDRRTRICSNPKVGR